MPAEQSEQHISENGIAKGIPLYDIIDCIENKKLSITETAKLLSSSKSNISTRLSKAGYRPNYLEHYKSNRADILSTDYTQ